MNLAIITARMASERLPGKAMLEFGGNPNLVNIINRLRKVPSLDRIVLATTADSEDRVLGEIGRGLGIDTHYGAPGEVLEQFRRISKNVCADYIQRVTCDCPFLSWELVDLAFKFVIENKCETGRVWGAPERMIPVYGAAEFPISAGVLNKLKNTGEHLVHDVDENRLDYNVRYAVPPSLYNATFYRPYRLELDTPEDSRLISHLFSELGNESLHRVIAYMDANPELAQINESIHERTGPTTSYDAKAKARWKHQQTLNSYEWQGDWSWLLSGSPLNIPEGAKPVFCSSGRDYLGYSRLGEDYKIKLFREDKTIITGRARLGCSCGAGKEWYPDRRPGRMLR